MSVKFWPFCSGLNGLTHKQLKTHGCELSTVTTDALGQKYQAFGTHGADIYSMYWTSFIQKYHSYSEQSNKIKLLP